MNLVHHNSKGRAFNFEHLALILGAAIGEVDDARRSNDDAIRNQQRGSLRGLEGDGQIPNDEDNAGMNTNRYAFDALEIFQLL